MKNISMTCKLILVSLFFAQISFAQVKKSIINYSAKIDSNNIKNHVAYLASDKLLGRLPGTPGYQMAADYVVNELQKYGLEPMGDNGTYFQNLILRTTKIKDGSVNGSFSLKNGANISLNFGTNISLTPHPKLSQVATNNTIVFVGAGYDKPNFGLSDYENIDCKGKIVLVYYHAPAKLSTNVVRHLSYPATLQKFAQRHGAIGILMYNPAVKPAFFTSRAKGAVKEGIKVALNKQTLNGGSSQHIGGDDMLVFGSINSDIFNQIITAEGKDISEIAKAVDAGKYTSFETQAKLNISFENKFGDVNSFNVLAKMKGSDPVLNKEYIVHSAHLDHLGTGTAVKGDSIYNGAHDNASGSACTLEIARIYGQMPNKPRRSIVFAWVVAEEMGLLGSNYLVNEPFTHKNNIVADVNMDMPTILAPLESIAPLGAEHSSFWALASHSAKALNLKIETDPDPTEGRFVRSDQYSFLKGGIPSLHVKYGYKYANPSLNLFEKVKLFRETHYHQVSDNFNDSFNWTAGRTYSRANFLISYQAANNKERVKFNAKDFFGED